MRALRTGLGDSNRAADASNRAGCFQGPGGEASAASLRVSAEDLRTALAQAHPTLLHLEIAHPRKDWQAA